MTKRAQTSQPQLLQAPASRARQALPRHLRPRREKLFGDGRPLPLHRNAKVRIMTLARALMRRSEPGKQYGHDYLRVLFLVSKSMPPAWSVNG
jgi:hypothetical protein